jgi:hypothetical protein
MPTELADGLGLRDVPLLLSVYCSSSIRRFAPEIGSPVLDSATETILIQTES